MKGFLYVGGCQQPLGEMKITKSLKQYDKKIVECKWDFEKKEWSFMRERTDKSKSAMEIMATTIVTMVITTTS